MKYKTEEIPRRDYKYLITIGILVVILFCLPMLLRGDSAPVKPFASEMKSRPDLLDFVEIYQDPTPNDSIVLTFPVFNVDTTYKWIDSSFLTLSSFIDTVCMALVVPYNFHMDSLVFAYKTTGKIDTVAFLVGKTNTRWIADSTLTISGSGTDRESNSLATVSLALSTDLYHGQLVKVKFFNSLTADENDIVGLAYCVIKGYQK